MVLVLKPEVKEYQQEVKLLDGTRVVIRPILSGDKNALKAFHTRLSQESLFLRYHYSKGELTDEDLINFCDVDYYDSMALVAERNRNDKKDIIGVGRYFRLPNDKHTAEVAFVVQDSEQRKGVGTQLLKHLAVLAWQTDIHFFLGMLLRENNRMLSILRKSDPAMNQVVEDYSTCSITFSVLETMFRTP